MALGTNVKNLPQRGKKPNANNSIRLTNTISNKKIRANMIRRGIHPAIVEAITKPKEKPNDGN